MWRLSERIPGRGIEGEPGGKNVAVSFMPVSEKRSHDGTPYPSARTSKVGSFARFLSVAQV